MYFYVMWSVHYERFQMKWLHKLFNWKWKSLYILNQWNLHVTRRETLDFNWICDDMRCQIHFWRAPAADIETMGSVFVPVTRFWSARFELWCYSSPCHRARCTVQRFWCSPKLKKHPCQTKGWKERKLINIEKQKEKACHILELNVSADLTVWRSSTVSLDRLMFLVSAI